MTATQFLTRRGRIIDRISDFCYRIEKNDIEGMKVPVTIYANERLLSAMVADRTLDQAVNVTTLPGVQKHIAVLPDGHEGYGFPVGGVAAMDLEDGVISPGGVGYDINCGVRLIRTDLTENDIRGVIDRLVNELFRAIPAGLGSEGTISLSKSQLDEVAAEGVRWAIERGYGYDGDANVCEEEGYMGGANPLKVSDTAKKEVHNS
jgi:tRNA-splicing ligase RtcB